MRNFRGLTKDGKMVYGWYCHIGIDHYIIFDNAVIEDPLSTFEAISGFIKVIPETVGQQIGKQDKNSKEIYEGDVVKVDRQDSFLLWNQAIIVYAENRGAFVLQYTKPIKPKGLLADCSDMVSEDKTTLFGDIAYWKLEVIGNVHQNPELLEKQ